MTPSLEGLPTKAKEAPSPHEVKLALLDTNPVFQSLWDKMLAIMVGWRLHKTWWPKHPKVAPLYKKRLHLNGTDDSNINDSKSHICSSFEPFENIISGVIISEAE